MKKPIGARALLLLLAVAAIAACAPEATPPKDTQPPTLSEPALVTVTLDVTGTGTGTITFSSDHGDQSQAGAVLYGWTYSYLASPKTPVVLKVENRSDIDSECAVHINGELRSTDTGIRPECSVSPA